MFLNNRKIFYQNKRRFLNHKHEMFLNGYGEVDLVSLAELNHKHEMFLN